MQCGHAQADPARVDIHGRARQLGGWLHLLAVQLQVFPKVRRDK